MDGTTLKARYLESADEAARLEDLIGRVGPPLAAVFARHGAVLLERWIEGETLSCARADELAEELGAVLARLHATKLPGTGACISTTVRREQAMAHLAALADSGFLPAELADALGGELARLDPDHAPAALVHLDYCPENLVIDPSGDLHVVDNEWLKIDACGVDLGRTWSRWPMSQAVWARFLGGYASRAGSAPRRVRFWNIVMAARSAVVRLETSAEIGLPLVRLRELAGAG